MVRKYKKTSRGSTTIEIFKAVLHSHLDEGYSIRGAAKLHKMSYHTLRRYIVKIKKGKEVILGPDNKSRSIFNDNQEAQLCDYLIRCSQMGFGLSSVECRKFAFELGLKNNLDMPNAWHANQMAGKDWFLAFRKRSSNVGLRKPENCSLSRATLFNPHNVKIFFDNLKAIYEREPKFSDPSNVYNLDETATTTVTTRNPSVIAAKNTKQVSQATSGERGILVTTCCFINDAGIFLPPAMVFPRINFVPKMLRNAVPNTLGLAAKTGWMTTL